MSLKKRTAFLLIGCCLFARYDFIGVYMIVTIMTGSFLILDRVVMILMESKIY
ncbi:hypothetical protein [Latilactobacillus fragifolii]|uniref:hypothetical protein n=1 Tax=Latilactobacillus fragifolii TaxID=2814244 RepID=UPI001ABBA500|nr:hypothetical protein [Latilactobacillus fragifolii]